MSSDQDTAVYVELTYYKRSPDRWAFDVMDEHGIVCSVPAASVTDADAERTAHQIRSWLAAHPETPDERSDGFAGYDGCPIAPCTGTLAGQCSASGDCAHLALMERLNRSEPCSTETPDTPDVLEEVRRIADRWNLGVNTDDPAGPSWKAMDEVWAALTRAGIKVSEGDDR